MMEITTGLVFVATFTVCIFIAHCFGLLSNKALPPGPWGLPVVGHLLFFGQDPPATFEKWRRKYGNVFRLQLGSWNAVVLNGYDTIKDAADNVRDTFSHRPTFMTQTVLKETNAAHSLAFGPFDDDYVYCRKVIASLLRSIADKRNAVDFQDLALEEADTLVKTFLKRAEANQPFSVVDDLQVAIGSTIYQLLYGRGENVRDGDKLRKMIENQEGFLKFAKNGNPFDVMPWLAYALPKHVKTFRDLNIFTSDMRDTNIKEHERYFDKENPRDVTDMFLATDVPNQRGTDAQEATRRRLLVALDDLRAAGFETTTTSLKWLILYMTAYPEVQRKVQQEISDIIGNERHVDIKDRKRLIYTDAVLHEVLRITCEIPFALPHCAGEDANISGYHISKGTVVIFNLHSIAHDKDFWGDPEAFRPDRFIKGDELDHHVTARVLPFGLGRRRCIGDVIAKMHLFIVFVTLMQKCSFVKPEGEALDLTQVPGLVYTPKPYTVLVEERL